MIATSSTIKAPFPYFGGKATVAPVVWQRFGNVGRYVEPFAGSLAVLLSRPEVGRIEVVSDANHFLANFWRATEHDPEAVARYCDWPVNECDLHARHCWLMLSDEAAEAKRRLYEDPDYYHAKMAGWWCWGVAQWIGHGWCDESALRRDGKPWEQLPRISDTGLGVHRVPAGGDSTAFLLDWFARLGERLRRVRVCYGDWSRVCSSQSTTISHSGGSCGVFLDPPYPLATDKGERHGGCYANDKSQCLNQLRDDVLAWCRQWGPVSGMRIAVCGYDGDGYEALEADGWSVVAWKAHGGYGNQGNRQDNGKRNRHRERIWFSPGCLPVADDSQPLLGGDE